MPHGFGKLEYVHEEDKRHQLSFQAFGHFSNGHLDG
jgi:hypothetical protein